MARRLGAGELPIGYLGVGAGAAAALMAADEPGALRAAADLACEWFAHHLVAEPARAR